jgi:hypothetical protein
MINHGHDNGKRTVQFGSSVCQIIRRACSVVNMQSKDQERDCLPKQHIYVGVHSVAGLFA